MKYISRHLVPVLLLLVAPWLCAETRFTEDTLTTREGYATVEWISDSNAERFEVKLTNDAGGVWSTHRVESTSLFVSGLVNGDYAVRVRAIDDAGSATSNWSAPLALSVTHHGRSLTLALFMTGLAVVTLTVGFLLATVLRVRPSPDGKAT